MNLGDIRLPTDGNDGDARRGSGFLFSRTSPVACDGAGRVQSTSEHMGQAESLYIPKRPDSPLFLEIPGELEYKQAKPMSHNVNYPRYSAISINTHTQKVLELQINV